VAGATESWIANPLGVNSCGRLLANNTRYLSTIDAAGHRADHDIP
jgi:hypothetical protein